jgi:putative transposase
MKKRAFTPEQVIGKLRKAEILLSQGHTVGEVSWQLGITEQTYCRWRWEYGWMQLEQTEKKVVPRQDSSLTSFLLYIFGIPALLRAKSALKKFRIPITYRQQMMCVPKGQDLLS